MIPSALSVTLADCATIFTVNFGVIGKAGSASPIDLVDTVTEREVGVNFATANFYPENGWVMVGSAALLPLPPPILPGGLHTRDGFSVPISTMSGRRYILEFTDAPPRHQLDSVARYPGRRNAQEFDRPCHQWPAAFLSTSR